MSHPADRLLVCGSRAWSDAQRVYRELDVLLPRVVIHGACPTGADDMADTWASAGWVGIEKYAADWERDGKSAGPKRNARMLAEGKPDRGLAFGALWKRNEGPVDNFAADPGKWSHRKTGTGDMVFKMLRAGLPVRWMATPGTPAVDLTAMPEPTEGGR